MGNKRQDIHFLNYLRAIAPLIVIWAHLGPWWCMENDRICYPQGRPWWLLTLVNGFFTEPLHLYQNGGHLGVLIFFLVSGFIITHVAKRETAVEFSLKRFFRIFPLLLVSLGLSVVTAIVLSHLGLAVPLSFHFPSFSDFVSNVFLVNHISVGTMITSVTWTLLIEVIFYALSVMTIGLTKTRPLLATWVMLLVIFLVTCWTANTSWKTLGWYLIYSAFIIFGRAVYLVWCADVKAAPGLMCAAASLLLFFLLFTAFHVEKDDVLGYHSTLFSFAIAAIAFCALAAGSIDHTPAIVRRLSDISYSIYLNHLTIGCLVLNVARIRYGMGLSRSFLLATVAVILFSELTYRLIEIPGQSLGRRLLTLLGNGRE